MRRRWLLGFLILAAVSLPASAQGFLSRYKDGLEAVELQNWTAAARSMRSALDERPEERLRLPLNAYFRPYVPHYYYGVALSELGDCEGALLAWSKSTAYGVIDKRERLYSDMTERRSVCEIRLREIESLARRVEATLAQARLVGVEVTALAEERDLQAAWAAGSPSLAERRERALESLDGVEPRLLSEERSGRRERLLEAEQLADRALEELALVRTQVIATSREAEQASIERSRADASKRIDAQQARARQLLDETEYLEPYPPVVGRARRDLERALEGARSVSDRDSEAMRRSAARIAAATEALRVAAQGPGRELTSAAEEFLSGSYENVIRALDGRPFDDRRARSHAHLLLAASRFQLYLLGSENDERLLDAARIDVRKMYEVGVPLAPSPRTFSPRFIQFFERVSLTTVPAGG